MSDLLDAMSDEEPVTPVAPQAPAEPVTPEEPQAPQSGASPDEGAESAAKNKKPRKTLPDDIDGEPAKAGSGSGKKRKVVSVSHEKRLRFAKTFGKVFNLGFNTVAAAFGSPARFTEESAKNLNVPVEKVWTIQFPDQEKTTALRKASTDAAVGELKAALGDLFIQTTPGEAIAYHLAGVFPNIAAFDQWLREHPFITLVIVAVTAGGQVVYRIVKTEGMADSADDIHVKDENGNDVG